MECVQQRQEWSLHRGRAEGRRPRDKYDWEFLQMFRFPQWASFEEFEFDVNNGCIHHLEVVDDRKQVELLLRVLHIPRVTPGFVKWTIRAHASPVLAGAASAMTRAVRAQSAETRTQWRAAKLTRTRKSYMMMR